MAAKVVYLDQNKWIDISRVLHGRSEDPGLKAIAEFMQEAAAQGLQRYPLSLAHYIETSKASDIERRRRLASVMLGLSGGETMAGPNAVVMWELDRALRASFECSGEPLEFNLFGRGARHLAESELQMKLDLAALSPEQANQRTLIAEGHFEFNALIGLDAIGMDRLDFRPQGTAFMETLAQVRLAAATLPAGLGIDPFVSLVLGQLSPAIEQAVKRCSARVSLPNWSNPSPRDVALWHRVASKVPSRMIDAHLIQQFAINPEIKLKQSDLNDVAYLGIAATYCDALVCEKQFADMLKRAPRGLVRARVLSDLQELPTL